MFAFCDTPFPPFANFCDRVDASAVRAGVRRADGHDTLASVAFGVALIGPNPYPFAIDEGVTHPHVLFVVSATMRLHAIT